VKDLDSQRLLVHLPVAIGKGERGQMRLSIVAAALRFLAGPVCAGPNDQSFPDLKKHDQGQTPPADHQYSICPMNEPAKNHISAIDVSEQIDQNFVEQAAAQHVQVIFRYYDWPSVPGEKWDYSTSPDEDTLKKENASCLRNPTEFNSKFDLPWKSGETIPGKTLTVRERDLILSKGMAIGTVFQHCNNNSDTFKDTKRAAFDAQRALDLAKKLGQPPGTAIFFGVDLEVDKDHLDPVKSYISTVKNKIERIHIRHLWKRSHLQHIRGNREILLAFAIDRPFGLA
jgi:Domain of unknown function (DUF1906)